MQGWRGLPRVDMTRRPTYNCWIISIYWCTIIIIIIYYAIIYVLLCAQMTWYSQDITLLKFTDLSTGDRHNVLA